MIRTQNLTKVYGDFLALKGVDLDVGEGDIFGFIGPNGAGKTTTIKILATLLEPTGGDAFVNGLSVWDNKEQVRSMLGYMPDAFGVYRNMTVTEYLRFFAAAYGLERSKRKEVIPSLLELTDLTFKEDALVDSLSKGMKQRLGLARALVHDPKVLILDEPAAGLDPRARIELREILRALQGMGKTILLSSHILSELAEVCNRLAIVEQGALVAQGSLKEILDGLATDVRIELDTTDNDSAFQVLEKLPLVASVDEVKNGWDRLSVQMVDLDDDVALLSEALSGAGIGIRHLKREGVNLEQAFMKLTQGLVQ